MISDVAVGYVCTAVCVLGLFVLIGLVSYLVYLHESKKVEEDNHSKEKSDIYG